MKFLLILSLCALAAAAPNLENLENHDVVLVDSVQEPVGDVADVQGRNILVNALVRQLIAYVRRIIKNGSNLFDIPPLDPLQVEAVHLQVPAGLVNLDLELKNAEVRGIGGFVVHKSQLSVRRLTFDLDISVPQLIIKTDLYDLDGDILTAIPIYGTGRAEFVVKNFRFQAMLHLGQSENEQSVIIDRIEGVSFQIPEFTSNIEGVIDGGDIDAIVNAIIEDVLIGYVNRFQGAISNIAAQAVVTAGNPILEQLDTWRFIAPLL